MRFCASAEVFEHAHERLGSLLETLGQALLDLPADVLEPAVGGLGQALDALAQLVGRYPECIADLARHRPHTIGQGLLLAFQRLALMLLGRFTVAGQGGLERGAQFAGLALLGQATLGEALRHRCHQSKVL